jgi:AmmeMemoRadiSam system protein B
MAGAFGHPAVTATEAVKTFPTMFPDPERFKQALAQEPPPASSTGEVCGITVPHHLLAVDLIARAFRLAACGNYLRVIVLFPDHFRQAARPFATTTQSFQTPCGPIATDTPAVVKLLSGQPRIEVSNLFKSDHGIHAVLPFVANFFPRAKLIPIAIAITSQIEHWDALVQSLKPLVTARTLIVQSTDFSHYLVRRRARECDQEALNAIATLEPEAILPLRQPAHLDSKGAQYIHMQLQRQVNRSVPEIIENKNSYDYLPWEGTPTTSYIVQIYRKPRSPASHLPVYAGQQVWFFAGDTSFGRYMERPLRNKRIAERLRKRILAITGGAPLVVNLEGVMLERPAPKTLPALRIAMDADRTTAWLRTLNVRAVILANNHTNDFGPAKCAGMQQLLQQAGIEALMHRESRDFKAFRLVALSDLANHGEQRVHLISEADLEDLQKRRLAQPVLTFIHWGAEYLAQPRSRELDLLVNLRRHGMPLVVGAHPHVASTELMSLSGGSGACVYSTGNFIFDQHDPRVSGMLVEARFFQQGTYALRLHSVGNLYHDVINPGAKEPRSQNSGDGRCWESS